MKKKQLRTFLILFSLLLLSCQGDGPDPIETDSEVEITVINEKGEFVPYIEVYLFENPPTDVNGMDPDKAISSGIANESGEVSFSLQSIPDDFPSVYFTVLERPLSLEYRVLGSNSLEITGELPLVIQKNVEISGREQTYPYGYVPTVFDSKLAIDEYHRWKTTMVRPCGDGLRVIADPSNETRVEAIGFGTILAAYANDKETFDGLMRFYESKRTEEANEMMGWLVTCETIVDPGSATDGDIDVAFANIIAHSQWGGDYLDKAIEIINLIAENLITDCIVNGETCKVLHPGYSGMAWGGCQMTDIQYYTPAFFRVFAQVTGDDVWNQLADDTYKLLNASAHGSTGLVPDWQTAEGTPGPGSRVGHYGYDACRVPWRMSLDYLWNGNSESLQWCTKISGWAYSVGATNIVDGYELDGTDIGNNGLNSAFLGGFTVAMMTNDYEKVTNFSETLEGLNDTYWFNLNTRILYLFALTGNFQEPEV